jgi:hypothetical protein
MVGLLREQDLRGTECDGDGQRNEQFCPHNGDKSTNLKLNLQF